MGYNYVLGTREEENMFEPVKVHPKMFFECKVRTVGTGSQHVVVLSSASQDNNDVPQLDFTIPMPEPEVDQDKEEDKEEEKQEQQEEEKANQEDTPANEKSSSSSKKRSIDEVSKGGPALAQDQIGKKLKL